MTDQTHPLSTNLGAGARTTGVLPYQALTALIRDGEIASEAPITLEQVQPASLDLRLGHVAYRVQASFLPGPERTVLQRIDDYCLHRIDLEPGLDEAAHQLTRPTSSRPVWRRSLSAIRCVTARRSRFDT